MTTNARGWYTEVFKAWQNKLCGVQPTNEQLTTAHYFGRPGKQCMALAMMLRVDGATASQIKQASALFDGNPTPHFNKMRELVIGGYFERLPTPGAFTIKLTAKGNGFINNKAAAAADTVQPEPKPAKVKGDGAAKPAKVKVPRKPKVKPEPKTDHVMPEPAPVTAQPAQAHTDGLTA